MTNRNLAEAFSHAVEKFGEEKVRDAIEGLSNEALPKVENILTIVVNAGAHHLPSHLLRGEVLKASEGMLDFSSSESTVEEFVRAIEKVVLKLKERQWDQIYLVPSGPANLSMLVKLVVYRVTHIETTDTFYTNGEYRDIAIELRPIVVAAETRNLTNKDKSREAAT